VLYAAANWAETAANNAAYRCFFSSWPSP
jgi:hypothetical protein